MNDFINLEEEFSSIDEEMDAIMEAFTNDPFGSLKIDKPESEGLDAAVHGADMFANASDGEDTDVELSIHRSFSSIKESSIEDELDSLLEEMGEEVPVDPMTTPNLRNELDQYSDVEPEGSESRKNMDPKELISDDVELDESFMFDDDLF